ncbi:unnamed protein product [Closterium sp. NIES-54]
MVQQVLQRFDFTYSSPQATPLSTRHSLSALPSDESVEPSGPYPELVGCLMYLMTCTRPDLAYPLSILARYVAPGRHRPEHMAAAKRVLRYLCSTSGLGLVLGGRSPVVLTGHADASWVDDLATQRSSQGYTFSLGSGSVSWRSTRSSSVLSSSCEADIYAGAMAAQELRWLTYLLIDLGEPPSSPPVLYVDNKAILALCREHRLEHRTKHIALRYFLARELQQRGQLRLAYVASQANTADIFTKALQPCDHQRFCTMLGARCVYRSSLGVESQGVRDRHIYVTEIAKTIEATTADLIERYLDTDKQFGGEGKCWLVGFLKLHGHGGGKKVRVRGVDGEGRPVNHLYTMQERKLPGHKVGSGYEECVKLCRSFARDCVDNLNERLDDLGKLEPTKLFRAGKWPKIKAQREKKCCEWLLGCNKLFRHKLSGFDLKAAERELPTFCAIMEVHHELESFTQGLTNILGSRTRRGAAHQNDGEEDEEEEVDVEQALGLGDDQELEGGEEEEDNPFLSDDEDVEEVFHIDRPVH